MKLEVVQGTVAQRDWLSTGEYFQNPVLIQWRKDRDSVTEQLSWKGRQRAWSALAFITPALALFSDLHTAVSLYTTLMRMVWKANVFTRCCSQQSAKPMEWGIFISYAVDSCSLTWSFLKMLPFFIWAKCEISYINIVGACHYLNG